VTKFSEAGRGAVRLWAQRFPLPRDYVAVDIESSGLVPGRHRVLHFGWCTVRDGCAVRSEGVVIDWNRTLDREALGALHRDMQLAKVAMAAKDQEYRWSAEALARRGVHPDEAVERIRAAVSGVPLVAHYGYGFDYPMLGALLGDPGLPRRRHMDTCLMARALLAPAPVHPGEAYEAYVRRLLTTRCARHALADCVTLLGLDQSHGADPKHAHDAEYDNWISHLLLERFRDLAQASVDR
jgi:hypothetical protein